MWWVIAKTKHSKNDRLRSTNWKLMDKLTKEFKKMDFLQLSEYSWYYQTGSNIEGNKFMRI